MTHGAVSRQARLERALGVERQPRAGPRALVPTPAARRLAATVRDALDDTETAAREIARRPPTGPLTLSCEPTLLMRWLIPRLPDLAERAPGASPLHLVAAGGRPLRAGRRIDLAIRRDDFPFPADTHATRLFAEHVGPVHRPDCPAAGTLLHTATRPDAWDDWRRRTGSRSRPRRTDLEHFSLSPAGRRLGVRRHRHRPYALVHDDLARGALTAPCGFVSGGPRTTCWAAARWRAIRARPPCATGCARWRPSRAS
ncbi:LysR substrate-binding domain-containing protein [Streptomyces sp. KL116D]|uniref:LysR substrate-binding domain-containing protein n=1 Tax=Streptomyces sp. KL116D TaxID=3045152 RepID=UPI00355729D5